MAESEKVPTNEQIQHAAADRLIWRDILPISTVGILVLSCILLASSGNAEHVPKLGIPIVLLDLWIHRGIQRTTQRYVELVSRQRHRDYWE